MNEVEPGAEDRFYDLLHRAGDLAQPIDITTSGIWSPGDLTTRYHEILSTLPLNPPPSWPVYRLNTQVQVKSGERTPVTGFYLPDAHGQDNASANDARIQRVPGGQPCQVTGWWYTPAAKASRRYFKQGDTMPKIEGSSFGDTYWLWDADQSAPQL